MRLIDADALQKALANMWYESQISVTGISVSVLISKQPTIDAVEVVQGEWKHTITGYPYCSNCEYVFGEDEEFSPFWNYCPMCGARVNDEVD